ncbi:alpha/beta fold hydrolase [Burkholderia stagnalis]
MDTIKIRVHIRSDEYDWCTSMENGREAQEAIAGSTSTGIHGLVHFPMFENPEKFLEYLLPALARLRASSGGASSI